MKSKSERIAELEKMISKSNKAVILTSYKRGKLLYVGVVEGDYMNVFAKISLFKPKIVVNTSTIFRTTGYVNSIKYGVLDEHFVSTRESDVIVRYRTMSGLAAYTFSIHSGFLDVDAYVPFSNTIPAISVERAELRRVNVKKG